MNKFLIAFAAVFGVCSFVNAVNVGYGNYGSSIGAYQLQQQPALTVQYLVPAYGKNSYGTSGYGIAPVSIPSYGSNSYGGVDGQAINLAIQALNAPSAGLPQIADPVITPALISTYGPSYSRLPASYSAPAVVPAYGAVGDAAVAASAAAAASNVANSVAPKASY